MIRVLALASLLVASQEPGTRSDAGRDLTLQLITETNEVELGKAFPLRVVRSWSSELVPEEWTDTALEPLVARLVKTTRQDDGPRRQETRHYDAYAFRRGMIRIKAPSLRARPKGGGPERVVAGNELRLLVISAVDLAAPGAAELPGPPSPAPSPWLAWTGAGLAGAVALALLLWLVRRRMTRRGSRTARLPPHLHALECLQRLREREPRGHEELRTDSVEASRCVREYLEERFALHAPRMATEELLAHPEAQRALRDLHRELLENFLAHCDAVKFGCHDPSLDQRRHHLDAVETFVRETGNEERAGP